MPRSNKANTPAKKRQWDHVESSELAAGKSAKVAAMAANSQVKKHPSRKKS